jgi:RNA polymerase sigma-70 factor (ECF subfamily)
MDENELVSLLKAGDIDAFRSLVDQHQNRVLNICYGFFKNKQDAEDAAQEVFIEVFRSVANFREDAKLSTWIYRIAVTKSLDLIRKKNRKRRLSSVQKGLGMYTEIERIPSPELNGPESRMESRERAHILKQAVDSLATKQKVAITLSKYEGFSNIEIAEIMAMSVPAVEALIQRAKANLRKKLYRYYESSLKI